jgi:hypothetical protein
MPPPRDGPPGGARAFADPRQLNLFEAPLLPTLNEADPRTANCVARDAWLAAGVPVFPCVIRGKDKVPVCKWRPLGENGGRRPLALDEAEDAWRLRGARDVMPGLDCEAVGAVVVDLDTKLGGVENFEALCRERGIDVGYCPMVRTPTGGLHLFFADPDGRWRNSASKLALGVDTRGAGGYVVGAGAFRRGFGVYEPQRPADLAEFIDVIASGRLPPPPPSLAELLDAHCLARARRAPLIRPTRASGTFSGPEREFGVDPTRPLTQSARLAGRASHNDELSAGLPERWTLEGALAAVAAAVPGTRNDIFAREAFTAGLRAQALGLAEDETVARLTEAAKAAGSDDAKTVDTITRCFSAGMAQAPGWPGEARAPAAGETSRNVPVIGPAHLRAPLDPLKAAKSRLRDTFLTATVRGSRRRIRDALVRTAVTIVDVQVRAKLAFTLAALLLKSGHSDAEIVEAVVACGLPRAHGLNVLRWTRKNVARGEVA